MVLNKYGSFSLVEKFSLEKVFVSKLFCRQPKHDAAVGTDDDLAVFTVPADVLQIAAASDGFHEWKQNCHDLGTDPLSVRIDWAAIGTGVFVSTSSPLRQ